MYCIQHCFICRPSDSTVSEDAGIDPRTVATSALAVRRSNHSARSHPHLARSHPQRFHTDSAHAFHAGNFFFTKFENGNSLRCKVVKQTVPLKR
jgi:hypothetical protein